MTRKSQQPWWVTWGSIAPRLAKRKPNRLYESMTRVERGGLVIRVWREEEEFKPGPDQEIEAAIMAVPLSPPSLALKIAEALDKLPKIAAYEILVRGNGAIVYPDWK